MFVGTLERVSFDDEGNTIVSFLSKDRGAARQTAQAAKEIGACRISVAKAQETPRSLNANSYFHLLVNRIAAKVRGSDDDVKRDMVLKYGAVLTENGGPVGLKLPAANDPTLIYPYCKLFDTRTDNGVDFNCWLLYKRTHTLNTAEMSRLIDGVVYEAKELGIETETPEQIAKMKSLWKERDTE